LLHHLTVERLRESFYSLKRKVAPGVDGVTWQEYEDGLEDRLTDLHGRVHRGAYRATPSRRVYIEKADGRKRPLAVPAIEDKLVQHAVVTILNQIYEEDFLGFSYVLRLCSIRFETLPRNHFRRMAVSQTAVDPGDCALVTAAPQARTLVRQVREACPKNLVRVNVLAIETARFDLADLACP